MTTTRRTPNPDETLPDPQFDPLIPLAPVFDNVAFPTGDLPPAFRDMVEATAADLSVDPAMCATITMAVLSAAVGGRVMVEGKPGWREPTNLYALTIAAPSELKSPANSRLVRPLGEAEKQLVADSARTRTEQATQKQIQDGIAKKAQEKAIKSGDHADREAACFEAQAAADLLVEAAPRLLCDDITSEALAGLAADQGGPMAVISAEGGLFETIAGRYSSGVPNLDIWLKGFSGEYFSSDRAGRRGEPIIIQRPTLTVGLMAQPVVLEAIGRNDQFKGRGLLARFLYCRPASRAGHRQFDTPKVPHAVREAYHEHVINLAVHYHRDRGAEVEVLTLDGQARGMLRDLWNRVELALRPGGDLAEAGEWAGKFKGMVLRIAGLLHLAEHGVIHDPVITAATMAAAVRIGDYFLVQARAALHVMGADPIFADATYVVDRIKAKGDPEITAKTIFDETRGRFKRMDDLLPVLDVLLEHGHLVETEAPKKEGPGRKPSPRFKVHPEILDPCTAPHNPHFTQNGAETAPERDCAESAESAGYTAATDYACRVHPGTPASPGACWTCDHNREAAA